MRKFIGFVCIASAMALVSFAAEPIQPQLPRKGGKGSAPAGASGPNKSQGNMAPAEVAEETLRAAGLSSDGDALLDFFRQRMQPKADLEELLALARDLGHADPDLRAQATAKLLARGTWAIPALRHVMNDLNNPVASKQARHCLDLLEGQRGADLMIAAAHLLATRKPDVAAETLLAFLPFAGRQDVLNGVKAALDSIAARPSKVDAALLAALRDPLPLRRAVAVEVLAGSGHSDVLPEIRKLLADANVQVRLRAALALVQRLDEPAVTTLIDLVAELPADERPVAEQALRHLAGEWAPTPALAGDDDLSRKLRREVWAGWWQTVDATTILAAFRRRTLSKEELPAAKALVAQLGDQSFTKREKATAEVIAQGSKIVGLLRNGADTSNPEHVRRVEMCLKQIAKNEARDKLPLSAPVLLVVRQPAGAAAALLGYLPFTEDRSMKEEVVWAVKTLVQAGGQAEAAVLSALNEALPERQIAAAEILLSTGGDKHWPAIHKLLKDRDPQVRVAVAVALVYAQDTQAVQALIDVAAELPRSQAREAEDMLYRLAGAGAPSVPSGDDPASRKRFREVWQTWWTEHAGSVNLAELEKTTSFMNLIVVSELALNGNGPNGFGPGVAGKGGKKGGGNPMAANPGATDRLVALDRNLQVQWQIKNLEYPIDFQLLPGDRVLIAEYYANRVTERDLKGKILWQVDNLPNSPMNVQRLANGNTFIALYGTPAASGGYSVMEVDQQGRTVATYSGRAGAKAVVNAGNTRGGQKLADGKMVCITGKGACIWLDAKGNELKQFPVGPFLLGSSQPAVMGNIDVTPKGHVLVANANNSVVEYDPDGKVVWQANIIGNRVTRLANGNTLVASETTGIVELDMNGKTVWQYQPPPGYQALRARQMDDRLRGNRAPVGGNR
jgi:HEAT repeat protein